MGLAYVDSRSQSLDVLEYFPHLGEMETQQILLTLTFLFL